MAFTPGESVVQYAYSDGLWTPAIVEGSDGDSPEVVSLFVLPVGTSPGYHLDGIQFDADGVAGTYRYDVGTSVLDLEVDGTLTVTGTSAFEDDVEVTGGVLVSADVQASNLVAGTEVQGPSVRAGETFATEGVAAIDDEDSPYTAGAVYMIKSDATADDVAVELPAAGDVPGRHYLITQVAGTNSTTITPDGSDTISGAASVELTAAWDYVKIVSDGTATWLIEGSVVTP